MGGMDTTLGELVGDATHFLDRPADHRRIVCVRLLLGGDWFARCRIAAIMINLGMGAIIPAQAR